MVFNAGTHTDAIRMHWGDLADLARPVVGAFATRQLASRELASSVIFVFSRREIDSPLRTFRCLLERRRLARDS